MNHLSIRQRLYLSFGAVVLILVALVTTILITTHGLEKASRWSEHSTEVRDRLADAASALIDMETGERGFLLTGDEASLAPYHHGADVFEKSLALLTTLTADNPTQQQRLARLGSMEREWQKVEVTPALALRRAVQPDGTGMSAVVDFEQQATGKTQMDGMRVVMAELDEAEQALNVTRLEQAREGRAHVFWVSLGGGIMSAILAGVLGFLISRSIVGPLREAEMAADAIAEGRLNAVPETTRTDEIGRLLKAFRRMDNKLSEIVNDVRRNSESVSVGARQIAGGNNDLSRRTQEQAASLEQTAASMEEMTSTVKQNAENAVHAKHLTGSVRDQARKGGEVVSRTIDAMSEINASSRKIVDIVGLIDDIAFQTNLLALNAAVEAARAGEQGRGFAVVASEVRSLASRSATAAKDIKRLVEESVKRVEDGSELVDLSGKTLHEIISSVEKVSDIVAEITTASQEQATGIDQVNQAVAQMDSMTQQNAALVEQAAAASNSLEQQAEMLKQQVAYFRFTGEREREVSSRPATASPRSSAPARTPAPTARTPAPAATPARQPSRPAARAHNDVEEWESF
ncbi:hypothetical protein GCM10010082_16450 [Kushneria pakistanensis]|uniref:Chemotaxis protein n=1 Tax=Kushneria pakistanensis TaxID=1508770 RepID=A0ABQ3FIF7_9GAMM|nr:methyl-accepting chemotaxis protein [Kushneria pakistanensis]GHC24552.1 hypothetical protein GCM10010082_16450 [Kushneria pakistanensis]